MVTLPLDPLFHEFGETASHIKGEAEASLTIIFDYREFDVFYEGGVVQANEVSAAVKSADATGVSLKDNLVIRGMTYKIDQIKAQLVEGLTILVISEA